MNKRKIVKLKEIYKKIPSIECKGLCHPSCTIIPVAPIEKKRIKERVKFNPFRTIQELIKKGFNPEKPSLPSCPLLKENRCSVYAIRPGICRLYGVAEGLECQFGCQTKYKLTKKEAYDVIRQIEEL
jgi:uncharacterized protein